MKIIRIFGHPVSVTCVYLLLLISGKSIGGFYVLYILMRLRYGVPDAIVSSLGLVVMLAASMVSQKKLPPLKPTLCILADIVLIVGLLLFFQASEGYNDATFRQTVPLLSFTLFAACVLSNVLLSVILFGQGGKSDVKPVQTS